MTKKRPQRPEPTHPPQDWSVIVPGERVEIHLPSGAAYAAVIDTKTSTSDAVWVIRDDILRTRQVFCSTEGIKIVPIARNGDRRGGSAAS